MTAPTALVLGAAVWAGGVASPALKRRAMHGVQLFHNGQIGHIIGCGAVGKHGPSEAQVIRQICLDNAVPDSCISLEEQSTNTYENIRNAMALLDSKSVIIITDKYHAPRARMTAKHLGIIGDLQQSDHKSRQWPRCNQELFARGIRAGDLPSEVLEKSAGEIN